MFLRSQSISKNIILGRVNLYFGVKQTYSRSKVCAIDHCHVSVRWADTRRIYPRLY